MGQQILVIDDSPEIHPLVKAILAGESAEIHSAYDANYGLILADSTRPDLILLDVDMPGMNGFDACVQLKANPATVDCPIIFLTAQSSPNKKVQGFGLGAVDYVTKPFNPAELLARVRSSMRTRKEIRSLSEKVLVDPLTGIWNRAMFDQRMTAEIALRARLETPLSVIMLDLDQFKNINDRFGHLTGDHVLKQVSRLISGLCRAEDVACRFGGDEFAIIAPNTTAADAAAFGERIRAAVADVRIEPRQASTSILAGENIRVTVSIGVAQAQHQHDRTMLQRADDALYCAKKQGKNRVSATAIPAPARSLAA